MSRPSSREHNIHLAYWFLILAIRFSKNQRLRVKLRDTKPVIIPRRAKYGNSLIWNMQFILMSNSAALPRNIYVMLVDVIGDNACQRYVEHQYLERENHTGNRSLEYTSYTSSCATSHE